ncbi:MAG: peptidyl-prolyl cis-trans isomerase [Myxococcaceae bacterium]|nr:MAG: peptidyl-prolyl cis-trans isomerase [Myxococcaceae bacterium]
MRVRDWGVFVSIALGCATAPSKPPPTDFAAVERARIAELELARDTRGEVLVSRARLHADPTVRARALLALGRVQDLSTAPKVAEALTDPVPAVRGAAAFAAGELALAWEPVPDETRALLAQALLDAEAKETDATARLLEVDALGRVRTPAALERLTLLLAVPTGQRADETDPRSEVPVRAAIALGVAARAKAPVPDSARPGLERLSGALLAPYRWAGVYALAQMKTPAARPLLLGALRDDDPEVRAIAAKGVSDLALAEDTAALRAVLRDLDGRVAAEAVRGLVTLASRCAPGPCTPAEALGELDARAAGLGAASLPQAVPPLLALAQAPVPESARRVLVRLRTSLRASAETAPDAVRATAAWLDCRMAAAEDRQRGWLDETLRCGHDRVPEVRRLRLGLEAVAASPRLAEARVQKTLLPFLAHASPQIRAAAAAVVPGTKAPELTPALRPLLQDQDPIVRASAVEALVAVGDRASAPGILGGARTATVDVVTTYAEALIKLKPEGAAGVARQWLGSPQAHVRHEGARVLTALESTPVRAPALPAKAEAPSAPPLVQGSLWRIETAHGPVVIAPDVEDAPVTVAQLSRLAREGYFRGLTFHRVVPDFVVQGGDPRGDGEGGPGFTLPCEVSPRTYLRGTVGMALAGKDTGGSQLFVSLSPQPHLDGRYTIIGTVVSGMEALDGMVEGDTLSDWVVLSP